MRRETEQNRTEQNRTEHNRTEQNRTEQNRTADFPQPVFLCIKLNIKNGQIIYQMIGDSTNFLVSGLFAC